MKIGNLKYAEQKSIQVERKIACKFGNFLCGLYLTFGEQREVESTVWRYKECHRLEASHLRVFTPCLKVKTDAQTAVTSSSLRYGRFDAITPNTDIEALDSEAARDLSVYETDSWFPRYFCLHEHVVTILKEWAFLTLLVADIRNLKCLFGHC